MSKTIETLIKRAERNGKAILRRRVRGWYGGDNELEECYAIEIDSERGIVELRHWGTVLIRFDLNLNYFIEDLYAQSASDVRAINTIANYYYLNLHAHYFPSKGVSEFHDSNENLIKRIEGVYSY